MSSCRRSPEDTSCLAQRRVQASPDQEAFQNLPCLKAEDLPENRVEEGFTSNKPCW